MHMPFMLVLISWDGFIGRNLSVIGSTARQECSQPFTYFIFMGMKWLAFQQLDVCTGPEMIPVLK